MHLIHRLLGDHDWETLSETQVPGIDIVKAGLQARGFNVEAAIDRLRSGFKIIHQECTVCGDRRTLRQP